MFEIQTVFGYKPHGNKGFDDRKKDIAKKRGLFHKRIKVVFSFFLNLCVHMLFLTYLFFIIENHGS